MNTITADKSPPKNNPVDRKGLTSSLNFKRKSSTQQIITKLQDYYKRIVRSNSTEGRLKKSKSISHTATNDRASSVSKNKKANNTHFDSIDSKEKVSTNDALLIKKALADDVYEKSINKTRPSSTFREMTSDKSIFSKKSSKCSAGKSSKDMLRQKLYTHRDEQL